MKYIYLLPILLFSCNNQKEKDRQLIKLNEYVQNQNTLLIKQKEISDSL